MLWEALLDLVGPLLCRLARHLIHLEWNWLDVESSIRGLRLPDRLLYLKVLALCGCRQVQRRYELIIIRVIHCHHMRFILFAVGEGRVISFICDTGVIVAILLCLHLLELWCGEKFH